MALCEIRVYPYPRQNIKEHNLYYANDRNEIFLPVPDTDLKAHEAFLPGYSHTMYKASDPAPNYYHLEVAKGNAAVFVIALDKEKEVNIVSVVCPTDGIDLRPLNT